MILATHPHAAIPSDASGAEALHRLVLDSLDDDQAVDTVSIPLAGKSSIAVLSAKPAFMSSGV